MSGSYANENVFRFSTKYLDAATGLYYYGYRFYDPVLGRWVSRDPIGEQGGLSLYGFVGNDPANTWDYLGLCEIGEKDEWRVDSVGRSLDGETLDHILNELVGSNALVAGLLVISAASPLVALAGSTTAAEVATELASSAINVVGIEIIFNLPNQGDAIAGLPGVMRQRAQAVSHAIGQSNEITVHASWKECVRDYILLVIPCGTKWEDRSGSHSSTVGFGISESDRIFIAIFNARRALYGN